MTVEAHHIEILRWLCANEPSTASEIAFGLPIAGVDTYPASARASVANRLQTLRRARFAESVYRSPSSYQRVWLATAEGRAYLKVIEGSR